MKRFSRIHKTLLPALLAGAFLTGCGGDAPQGQAGRLSGTVRVDGSSTVYPITEAVAEEFMLEHRGARVNVGVSGTGGGMAKLLRGEVDVTNASRPIKESELAQARQGNVEFIELPVAYDGLAIAVNPQNTWVDCLTVEELARMWAPGSQINNWSQVRNGFPDQQLSLYGAGTDSGTYDYFTEAINGEEGASRTDYSASEDDNVLVQGVAGDRGALGFFGFAYYHENRDKLKLVGIDDGDASNGDGCVLPTPETIRTGTYQPLSRPLFIYVRRAAVADPAVQAFVEYYLQTVPQLAEEVGYVPLTAREYDLALQRFRNGVTGSLFEHGSQVGVTLEDLMNVPGAADTTPAAIDSTAL